MKNKYKDTKSERPLMVIAHYQPAYMDSPIIEKITRHKDPHEAYDKVAEHKKNGAYLVEVYTWMCGCELK